jgi:aminoglycoside 6'-N-acetyltransferase I
MERRADTRAVRIEPLTAPHEAWFAMRRALWPECPDEEHRSDMARQLAEASTCVQFMAYLGARAVGFAEAAVRRDAVNGTAGSPVAFLEGLYVEPVARRQGVARALVQRVADWAVAGGFRELASDALIENTASQAMHHALGFEEMERVVCFRRRLP